MDKKLSSLYKMHIYLESCNFIMGQGAGHRWKGGGAAPTESDEALEAIRSHVVPVSRLVSHHGPGKLFKLTASVRWPFTLPLRSLTSAARCAVLVVINASNVPLCKREAQEASKPC